MKAESLHAVNAYNSATNRLKETPGNTNAREVSGNDFSQMVKNLAESAVEVGKKSEAQSAAAASGKADLNSVVVAVAEAELTLNTVVAVRDKVVQAYQEILRMPI
ncbi:MAG: flagellar hook-basal body complex protein FliE [Pseudomonadota bacterium]|nr:flagellar hook-basal body complex protein FliE [Pseudomonadota bacterium]